MPEGTNNKVGRNVLGSVVRSGVDIERLLDAIRIRIREVDTIEKIEMIQKNIRESLTNREAVARDEYTEAAVLNEFESEYVNPIIKKEYAIMEKLSGILHENYEPGKPIVIDEIALTRLLPVIDKWFAKEAWRLEDKASDIRMKYIRALEEKRTVTITGEQLISNSGERIVYESGTKQPRQNPYAQQPVNPRQNPYAQQPVNPRQNPYIQQPVTPRQNPYTQQPVNPRQNPYAQQPVVPTQNPNRQQATMLEYYSVDNERGYSAPKPSAKCTCDEKLSKRIRAGIALGVTIVGMAFANQFFNSEHENKEVSSISPQPAITYTDNSISNEATQYQPSYYVVPQRTNEVQVHTTENGINREKYNFQYEGFRYLYRGIEEEKIEWIAGEIETFGRCTRNENESDYDYVMRYTGLLQSCYQSVMKYGENTPQEHVSDLVIGTEKLAMATFEYEIALALKEYDPVKYGALTSKDIEIQTDYSSASYKVIVFGEVIDERSLRNVHQYAFDIGMAGFTGMRTHAQTMEGWGELTTTSVKPFMWSFEMLGESLKCANANNQSLHYSPETGFVYDIDLLVQINREEYSRQLIEGQERGRVGRSKTTNSHGRSSSDDRWEI